MSLSRFLVTGAALTILAVGCATSVDSTDGTPEETDAGQSNGADAARPLPGADGSATPTDATADGDGAALDAADAPDAPVDATTDAAVPDASVRDASVLDTSIPDTSVPDTSIPDTSVPDTSVPDTGTDSGPKDAGKCTPVLTGFTPVNHSATRAAGSCTASQIQGFYDACLGTASTAATCTTWRSANPSCDVCLTGDLDPAGAAWGPLVQFTVTVDNNQGGCLALDQPTKSTCAHDLQYRTECEHAACDVACGNASSADYDACLTSVETGLCKTYFDKVNSDCAGITSTCFGGTDFQGNFKLVAAKFCQ
jgi:hypothetical protein